MKIITILLLFFWWSSAIGQKKAMFENRNYEISFRILKDKNPDSVVLLLKLHSRIPKSLFILKNFHAQWTEEKESLIIELGDDYKFFRESYYPMTEIPPDSTYEFISRIKNYFTQHTTISLYAEYIYQTRVSDKKEYFNTDFNEMKNVENLFWEVYVFKAPDLDEQ